jgi:hypothetical protein
VGSDDGVRNKKNRENWREKRKKRKDEEEREREVGKKWGMGLEVRKIE